MGSKINDIYQINVSDLEKDLKRVQQILNNEKEMIRLLNFEIMFSTEVDVLHLYVKEMNEKC